MPPTIHILGDSHASIFTGLHGTCPAFPRSHTQALPGFAVRHLGPFLAHSIASSKHRANALARRVLKYAGARDRIAFFFGEIDCRAHIVKRVRSTSEIEAAARELARNYAGAARRLVGARPLCFIGLPPPTNAQHGNVKQPTVGTFKQRRLAVSAFNAALQGEAAAVRARFLDLHDQLSDARGAPNRAFFADGLHADPRALPMFLAAFERIGWIGRDHPARIAGEALSRVPPPGGARVLFPGLLQDAERARSLLIERAALRCRAAGAKAIAVMGAGQHTQAMGLEPFRLAGLRVRAILDDKASADLRPRRMLGVPVLPPEQVSKVDAVVISSDAHEEALLQRARQVFGDRVLVVPIYR